MKKLLLLLGIISALSAEMYMHETMVQLQEAGNEYVFMTTKGKHIHIKCPLISPDEVKLICHDVDNRYQLYGENGTPFILHSRETNSWDVYLKNVDQNSSDHTFNVFLRQ